MDFSRLRPGELIAAVSSVVLFIVMFISWYGVKGAEQLDKLRNTAQNFGIKVPDVDTTASAWQAFSWVDLFLLLTIIVALGLALLTATQRSPALPVSASVITAALGILGTLLVLYRIVNQPGDNDLITVKIGAYIGLVAVAAIAYGGWRSMSDEGTSFADARSQVEQAAGMRGESRPAPPPPAAPADKGPTTEPPATPPTEQAPPAQGSPPDA